jgi:hypothetical protein
VSTKNNSWSRREFIQKSAAAGAVLSFSPFYTISRIAEAQSPNKTRASFSPADSLLFDVLNGAQQLIGLNLRDSRSTFSFAICSGLLHSI